MNIVLYTQDFDPITVIDLPLEMIELGAKLRFVRVAVPEPFRVTPPSGLIAPSWPRVCDIEFHRMSWYGQQKWVMTTRNEEAALALRPSWLPGQQGEVNRMRRQAQIGEQFALALMRALGAAP